MRGGGAGIGVGTRRPRRRMRQLRGAILSPEHMRGVESKWTCASVIVPPNWEK